MAGRVAGCAHGQQRRGVGQAAVEDEAFDPDAVDVRDLHGVDAVVRMRVARPTRG